MYEFIDKDGNISANSANLIVIDKNGLVKQVGTGGGGSPTGPAGGDLSGTYPNPNVVWANGQPTYDLIYYPLSSNPAGYLTQDNVVEYANLASFPVTGVIGTIYIALDTGLFYSWSGSAYVLSSAPNTGITGVGIANYVPKWTSPTSIGNSNIISVGEKILLFGSNSGNTNGGLNIIGINSTSYGSNSNNPAIINLIPNPNGYPVNNAVSGIQSQDFNAGNVRAGIYFQAEVANAGRPAIVFRTDGPLTERLRIGQDGIILGSSLFKYSSNLSASYDNRTLVDKEYVDGLITGGTVTSVGATSPITSSGGATPVISTSMTTNKLIGRSTAGTGVMEEITVGSGLTLTGAGILNNTATPTPLGYYGAFSDVTDQFATVINTGYPMLLGVTDLTNGVTVVSGSRVTIANTGIYNIQWSAQFRNPTANEHDVTIWLRKNGVDVPGSAGVVSVPKKHGSFDGHNLPSWNFLLDAIAGDYYEFVWSTQDLAVFISFEPAGSPPPSTASVVLTVTQQSGIMAGTGITAINSLTGSVQTMVVGTGATNLNIVSSGSTHTFNLLFNIRRNANNSSNNNINYNGYAVTGSAESSAVWTITRLTISASGAITIGTATNVAWTNRESATYT